MVRVNTGSSQVAVAGWLDMTGMIRGPNMNCLVKTQKPNTSARRRLRSGTRSRLRKPGT